MARTKEGTHQPVYGELLFRQATWHATLLRPFLYVIDSKRALSFGEAQVYSRNFARYASAGGVLGSRHVGNHTYLYRIVHGAW